MALTLDDLRRYAVARTLFPPTTLLRAIERLGFVQADPIRAPARAQDLILRHRVRGYRAGDLERRYARLPIEEDFFVNYGFLPRGVQVLMHPRKARRPLTPAERRRAAILLAHLRDRGPLHPREIDGLFGRRTVRNDWGGTSNAVTHLLDALHYRSQLRVVRRDAGVRVYASHSYETQVAPKVALDVLTDLIAQTYAPLPQRSLHGLVLRLAGATPQWRAAVPAALARAKARMQHATVDGLEWFWPAHEDIGRVADGNPGRVRLLAPFDPIVWDRLRFELLWGWAYRFEAYTPAAQRKLGYYALPLLRGNDVIGWGNLTVTPSNRLRGRFGFVAGRKPRDARFRTELEDEMTRMRRFLALT
jgi:uncharacterized protein YcaQ